MGDRGERRGSQRASKVDRKRIHLRFAGAEVRSLNTRSIWMVAGPVKQIGQECHSKISELPRYLGRIGKGKLRESNDTLWNGKADRAELDGIGQGRRVAGDDHECYRGKLSDCWEGGVWDFCWGFMGSHHSD